mgnify:CR=1 FL=1
MSSRRPRRSGELMKFGVYIPVDLAEELKKLAESLRVKSRSKLLQEALRLYILENKWSVADEVAGSIGILYNHEVRGVDEELTDVQHEFLDIIVSALHVHLDKERCMLIIAIRGASSRVRELVSKVNNLKGVVLVRPMLLAISRG